MPNRPRPRGVGSQNRYAVASLDPNAYGDVRTGGSFSTSGELVNRNATWRNSWTDNVGWTTVGVPVTEMDVYTVSYREPVWTFPSSILGSLEYSAFFQELQEALSLASFGNILPVFRQFLGLLKSLYALKSGSVALSVSLEDGRYSLDFKSFEVNLPAKSSFGEPLRIR